MRLACFVVLLGLVLSACSCGSAAQRPTPPAATTSPSPATLSLDDEVGAVMIVGFRGALSDQVLADWRQRQFGGLLIVNLNQNAATASDMSAVISSIRATSRRRLIAATD